METIKQMKAELGVETDWINQTIDFRCLPNREDSYEHRRFGLKVYRNGSTARTKVTLYVPVYWVIRDCLHQTGREINQLEILRFKEYIKRQIWRWRGACSPDQSDICINVSSDFSGVDAENFVWTEHTDIVKKQIQKALEIYEWFHGNPDAWMGWVLLHDSAKEEKDNGND